MNVKGLEKAMSEFIETEKSASSGRWQVVKGGYNRYADILYDNIPYVGIFSSVGQGYELEMYSPYGKEKYNDKIAAEIISAFENKGKELFNKNSFNIEKKKGILGLFGR